MVEYTYKKNTSFQPGTSYAEQFIYRCLNQVFEARNRIKEPVINMEFDIEIKELNLRIEYSGEYWHIGKEERDERRREYCRNNSISYIEIIEKNEKCKPELYTKDLYTRITISSGESIKKINSTLIGIIGYILSKYGHSIDEIDTERAIYESLLICKKYKYKVVRKNGEIVGTTNILYATKENTKNINEEHDNKDTTLIARHSTMSKKEFNRLCKRVLANWDNF